jgi:hypothetical protein
MVKTMPLSQLKSTLTAVLLLTGPGLGASLMTSVAPSRSEAAERPDFEARPAAELSLADFKELKALLDLQSQPWTTIPWKYSITEARKQAAASKKPIFMVVNTGNALGCT